MKLLTSFKPQKSQPKIDWRPLGVISALSAGVGLVFGFLIGRKKSTKKSEQSFKPEIDRKIKPESKSLTELKQLAKRQVEKDKPLNPDDILIEFEIKRTDLGATLILFARKNIAPHSLSSTLIGDWTKLKIDGESYPSQKNTPKVSFALEPSYRNEHFGISGEFTPNQPGAKPIYFEFS